MKNEPEKHAQQHLQHLSEHESKVQAKSIHKKKRARKPVKVMQNLFKGVLTQKLLLVVFLHQVRPGP